MTLISKITFSYTQDQEPIIRECEPYIIAR